MQKLAIKPSSIGAAAIDRITDDGKTRRFEMDADLVCPPSLKTRLTQGDAGKPLNDAKMGDCLAPSPRVDNRHS
jgi:hypothetical protein